MISVGTGDGGFAGSSAIALVDGSLGIEMGVGVARVRFDGELRRGDLVGEGAASGSLDMFEAFLFNELRGEVDDVDASGADGVSLRLFTLEAFVVPAMICRLVESLWNLGEQWDLTSPLHQSSRTRTARKNNQLIYFLPRV